MKSFCFKQANKNYSESTSKQLKLRVLFVCAVIRSYIILTCAEDYYLSNFNVLCIPRRVLNPFQDLCYCLFQVYFHYCILKSKSVRVGKTTWGSLDMILPGLLHTFHVDGPSFQLQFPWDSVENEYKSGKSLAFSYKREF